jgi:glycosyltransferase involved in cell wall biosynthesis
MHIEQTITSVLSQHYRAIEYIIIDGGSDDGTIEIIKKYASKLAYWESEPDKGIYDAMNKGIGHATGRIINLLNCGDCYVGPDVLDTVARAFCSNKDIAFFVGRAKMVQEDGSDCLIGGKPLLSSLAPGVLHSIGHQAFFYERSLHDRFGLYNLAYRYYADFDFIYRVFHDYHLGRVISPDIVVHMQQGGVSASLPAIKERKLVLDKLEGRKLSHYLITIHYHLLNNPLGSRLLHLYQSIKNRFLS